MPRPHGLWPAATSPTGERYAADLPPGNHPSRRGQRRGTSPGARAVTRRCRAPCAAWREVAHGRSMASLSGNITRRSGHECCRHTEHCTRDGRACENQPCRPRRQAMLLRRLLLFAVFVAVVTGPPAESPSAPAAHFPHCLNPNSGARIILKPEGYRLEDRNPGFIQLVEGPNLRGVGGKWVMVYSVEDHPLPNNAGGGVLGSADPSGRETLR
jgi:hypothetical protein